MSDGSDSASRAQGRGLALSAAGAVDRVIVWSAASVAVATTLALFFSVGAEVVARYGTGRSLGWTSEMPNLFFPWMTMAGIVLSAQFGRHIVVELGVRLLPQALSRPLLVLVQVPVAVVFAYLAWTGLTVLEVTAGERFPATRITTSWAYLAVVVGFALLAVTAATTAVRLLATGGDPFAVRNDDAVGGAE